MRKTNKIAVIVLFFAIIFGTEIASIIPDSSTAPITIEAEPAETEAEEPVEEPVEEPEDASLRMMNELVSRYTFGSHQESPAFRYDECQIRFLDTLFSTK